MEEKDLLPNSIGNFEILENIGKGTYANIYNAINFETKTKVAIKVFLKKKINKEQFFKEVEIMKKIDFPFIIPLYSFEEDLNFFYLIMEKVEGKTLLELINEKGKFTEPISKFIFFQILCSINYLHKTANIIHRDLKLENILISNNGIIRIIDFGLSKIFQSEYSSFQTKCGSIDYTAPEIFSNSSYNINSDIWSIGIVLYILVTGKLPFEDKNESLKIKKIVEIEPEYPLNLSLSLKNLLSKLLCKNPLNRITLDEIFKHEWFLNFKLIDLFNHLNSNYFLNNFKEFFNENKFLKREEIINLISNIFYNNDEFNEFNEFILITKMKYKRSNSIKKDNLKNPIFRNRAISMISSKENNKKSNILNQISFDIKIIKNKQNSFI